MPVIARVRGFIDHLLRYRPRHYPVLKRFAGDAADAVGILLSFVMNTLAATTMPAYSGMGVSVEELRAMPLSPTRNQPIVRTRIGTDKRCPRPHPRRYQS